MSGTAAPDTGVTPQLALPPVIFAAALMIAAYRNIGLPPVVIVGGSSVVGLILWMRAYRAGPIAPGIILPPFLLTVAALEVHMTEEYLAGFAPAMSRLFDISWTERSFLLVFAFIGPCLYALTALGLFRRIRLAGFFACFIFVGPGVAEFTHFIFPLVKPALAPYGLGPILALSDGQVIGDMRNYWLGATGRYYFPGLYTAILPMVPGIYGIVAILRPRGRAAQAKVVT